MIEPSRQYVRGDQDLGGPCPVLADHGVSLLVRHAALNGSAAVTVRLELPDGQTGGQVGSAHREEQHGEGHTKALLRGVVNG